MGREEVEPVAVEQARRKGAEDEDCSYNSLGDDLQLDESIQELKRISAIPQLKNTEKLSNKIGRDRSPDIHSSASGSLLPLQRRLHTCMGDPDRIAALVTGDVKMISDQIFSIWNRLIELMTINPKFVTEFLRIIYEEKMREYWGEHIYRTIVETRDFAIPSEENVVEIHRQIAQQKRQNLVEEKSR